MQIQRFEIHHVAMPLIEPWRTAYGEDITIESILVKAVSDDHVAWSESAPHAAPCYSPEWAGAVFQCIKQWLAPALVGVDLSTHEDVTQRMSPFKGNLFAKAALDNVWWSLKARMDGVPLHRALGATRDVVDVGADFGVMTDFDALLSAIGGAVEDGFARVKLKFRPGWDVAMLEAVRGAFPDLTVHIDCNSAYRLKDKAMFRAIDRFNLAMIEQPLAYDDLNDHAVLAHAIDTPICLDESITSLDRARQAIEVGSCRWINIKPGRVGGLSQAREIHDLCREAGVGCWVGGMLESAVGTSLLIALATLDGFNYPPDIFPTDRFYTEDLADPPIRLCQRDGKACVVAADVPGIGPAPVTERLDRWSVAQAVVG